MATKEQQKEFLPLDQLVNWSKNPRSMNDGDQERLEKQLLTLGQYKPLLITKDGEYWCVLGGNMRLTAMKSLVEKGHDEFGSAWVSYVDAPTEKRKLEFALSDNDRAGHYDEDKLVGMMRSVADLALTDYHIDTAYTVSLESLGERYDMADVRATGSGGEVADRSTVKEKRDIYDNNTIKQIVCYFPDEEYRWAMALLESICEAQGLQNNTEAIVLALKEYEENHSV